MIALDHVPAKLDLAAECGADITLNIGTDDAETVVRDLTEGYGADVYLDATGHPSAVPQGLNLLRKLGRYVEYGVFAAPVTVDWTVISDVKELDVLGAHLGPYCWPTAISMIERKPYRWTASAATSFRWKSSAAASISSGAVPNPSR